MVYRTLHSYILRELLRIFFLTASALTTLLAFGGMFRPLTRQGIEVQQLMVIMINLMPAMLAYAIPIAALFAAVLVYWRMSTDNELTACRAGGISFISIVTPAFFLGLVVASVDLVFVNYVVPRFLQSTERAVMRDLGSIIVSTVGRQEKFQYDKLVVYADGADEVDSGDPNTTIVKLHGMAASIYDANKLGPTAVAREAILTIRNLPGQDAAELSVDLQDASGFDPGNAFRRATGSINSITPDGRPFVVPSQLRSKPKFLNWRKLRDLNLEPTSFPPVAELISRIDDAYRASFVAGQLRDQWEKVTRNGTLPMTFEQNTMGAASCDQLKVYAPIATLDLKAPADRAFVLSGKSGAPVRVEQVVAGRLQASYTADAVDVQLTTDPFSTAGDMSASLIVRGNVRRSDHIRNIAPVPTGTTILSGIVLPASVTAITPMSKPKLMEFASNSPQPDLRVLAEQARQRIQKLYQTIDSELHSRGSFSLSCLTLVLLGAALGILLRGKNPLAVFVMGFVPAVVLVLLITAGRQLAEGNPKNVTVGIAMIWGGNIILVGLIAGVYAKLLKH